jgi:hypothetical protein
MEKGQVHFAKGILTANISAANVNHGWHCHTAGNHHMMKIFLFQMYIHKHVRKLFSGESTPVRLWYGGYAEEVPGAHACNTAKDADLFGLDQ